MGHYDVIVIGGGPAGSTVASFLAMEGINVLVLEKEKFPREHIGESLIPASYFVLNKLGVFEDLKKISPRKPGVNFISNDGKSQSLWCFKSAVKNESYLSFHVKRSLFDKMLLDNSKRKGAEVLEEHTVNHVNLNADDGNVEVKAINSIGETRIFKTNFLIDASGLHTFLGKKLGVKKSIKNLDRVALWTHYTGADYDIPLSQGAIKLVYLTGEEKKGWIWAIPISKDNISIGVVINNSFMKAEKAKYSTSLDWKYEIFNNEIKNSISIKKLLQNATMDHKIQVNGDYSYFCETKYGNNFAMIGDAGAFLDPIFSSGIFVGMQSAEMVSKAIIEKIKHGNNKLLEETYVRINGALMLIEKFIKLFYSPENINFSEMGNPEEQIQTKDTDTIYSIFHFLLSGDFFENYEKYSAFIDTIQNPKMLASFKNLIRHKKFHEATSTCDEDPEKMYGEMTHKIEFDLNAFT